MWFVLMLHLGLDFQFITAATSRLFYLLFIYYNNAVFLKHTLRQTLIIGGIE